MPVIVGVLQREHITRIVTAQYVRVDNYLGRSYYLLCALHLLSKEKTNSEGADFHYDIVTIY